MTNEEAKHIVEQLGHFRAVVRGFAGKAEPDNIVEELKDIVAYLEIVIESLEAKQ